MKLTRKEFVERLIWSGYELGVLSALQYVHMEKMADLKSHGGTTGVRAEILSGHQVPFACCMGFLPPRPLGSFAVVIEDFWDRPEFQESLLGNPDAEVGLDVPWLHR